MSLILRRILIIVGAVVLALFLIPSFLPGNSLKRYIVQTAYEDLNVALSIDSVRLSFLPTPGIDLVQIKFSTRQDSLPMGLNIEGDSPLATVKFSVWGLLAGKLPTTFTLHKPRLTVTRAPQAAEAKPPPMKQETGSILDKISLDVSLQEGIITWSAGATPYTFELKSFQAQSPRLSEYLTLTAFIELPKTKTADGAQISAKLDLDATVNWDLPWTAQSIINVFSTKLRVTDLTYISQKHHVIQKKEQPIYLEARDVEIHASKNSTIKNIILRLDEQTIKASAVFKLFPFLLQGDIQPFEASFETFPFRLLQDAYPGASGLIRVISPLAFAYQPQTKDTKTSLWQLQLDGLTAENISLPLPWFILEQNHMTLSGRLHYFPPSEQAPAQLKMINTSAQLQSFDVTWDGNYFPQAQRGTLSLDKQHIDMGKVQPLIKNILPLEKATGSLHVPSRLLIHFAKDAGNWKTTLSGRLMLSDISGVWTGKDSSYDVENLSGSFLLDETHSIINSDMRGLSQHPTRSSDADLSGFALKNVKLKAQGHPGRQWDVALLSFGVGDGQVKIEESIWNVETRQVLIGKLDVLHNNLPEFLSLFGGGWSETVQGGVRISAEQLSLPLSEEMRPNWKAARGGVRAEFKNLSWIALPIQRSFSRFFESYLERYRIYEVLERKDISEYTHTLKTSFAQGTLEFELGDEVAEIKKLSLMSPESTLNAKGKASHLKSLKELKLSLAGTYSYTNPGFLYGNLRKIMLDEKDTLRLPFVIGGTLTVPDLTFDQKAPFALYDKKAKAIK